MGTVWWCWLATNDELEAAAGQLRQVRDDAEVRPMPCDVADRHEVGAAVGVPRKR